MINRFVTDMITSPGGRHYNEDNCNFLSLRDISCWVLADGLGGQGGGQIASQLACDTILRSFQKKPEIAPLALASLIDSANHAILEQQKTDPALMRMASTVVVLISDFKEALWSHLGDSRLYHFRNGKLIFQTKDHSVSQSLVDAGDLKPEQLRFHADRSSLRRSLGRADQVQTSTFPKPVPIESGDGFLLCSDGFWELIEEVEMEVEYSKARTPTDWLRGMEFRIFRKITPESDNYSAVAVFAQ